VRADSDGFMCSQATERVVQRRSSERVFDGKVNLELVRCQGYEHKELDAREQTYLLRVILEILAEVYYIHYRFNYFICSVNKHC